MTLESAHIPNSAVSRNRIISLINELLQNRKIITLFVHCYDLRLILPYTSSIFPPVTKIIPDITSNALTMSSETCYDTYYYCPSCKEQNVAANAQVLSLRIV